MTGTDLRYTCRALMKGPGFSLAVIGIMALSIGACTAIFSLVKTILLTPLPYDEAEKPLAIIWEADANADAVTGIWARNYSRYRDETRSFESVAAVTTQGYNLNEASAAARVTCARVSANLFPMLGVALLRGRWFDNDEDREGANRAVVLSHALWRSRFGSDGQILGKTVRLDLQSYTVVGIMPESFAFPPRGVQGLADSECWVPASFSKAEMLVPGFNWVLFARMKRGVTFQQASQDTGAVTQRILESYPAAVQKEVALRSRVVALADQITAGSRTALFVFAGAVGFVLMIGCANVANLLLARLHVRQRELAVRHALGATRRSLVAQVLAECVLLASLGGVAGVPIAIALLRLLVAFSPSNVPRLDQVRIDALTLVFTVGCSMLAGLLFGLPPAFRSRDFAIAQSLGNGTRGGSIGGGSKLRSVLAVAEIAMAVVLLSGAGLLLRSFLKVVSLDPGFDPKNVLTFSVSLPADKYQQPIQANAFARGALDRMQHLPGVTHAAVGTNLPAGTPEYTVISRRDAPPQAAGYKPAAIQIVSKDYHRALAIALRSGRLFDATDVASSLPVALINETMARRYWPDSDPIGKQMLWVTGLRNVTVVGVVADVRQAGVAESGALIGDYAQGEQVPTLFVPLEQSPQPVRNLIFVVRATGRVLQLAPTLRAAVAEVDGTLPIFGVKTAEQHLAETVATPRFNTFVVMSFALSALILAALGLYAVTSYLVNQSSRDFGIRIALGASSGKILRLVMIRGLGLACLGVLIGIGAASGLTQFLSGMLFGIDSNDGLTLGSVVVVLMAVAVLASMVPAIRAARVDPVVSLRQE